MATAKLESPPSILALNDDCLALIFKALGAGYRVGGGYTHGCEEILQQINAAQTCKRFRHIFVHLIWITRENHLTLRPHVLERSLGRTNYEFYIEALQRKFVKLEFMRFWHSGAADICAFVDEMAKLGIYSFPSIETLSTNSEIDFLILDSFLPKLRCLWVESEVKCINFLQNKTLEELYYQTPFQIKVRYFRQLCTSFMNLRKLQLVATIKNEPGIDNTAPFTADMLPIHLESIHLNISAAKLVLPATYSLKGLQQIALSFYTVQSNEENKHVVQNFLLKNVYMLKGFGYFHPDAVKWDFTDKILGIGDADLDLERVLFSMKNLQELCFHSIGELENENILRLVANLPGLKRLEISECELIDFETLLPAIIDIRARQNAYHCSVNERLSIYSDNGTFYADFAVLLNTQDFIQYGKKCNWITQRYRDLGTYVFSFV